MTTNLLLLYPDIPQSVISFKSYGDSVSDTSDEMDFHPAVNTFRGERWQEWQGADDYTAHNIVYDLGTSVTKAVSFLVLARMDWQIANCAGATDFLLQSSPDDSVWTSRISLTDIDAYTSADLTGRFTQDYVTTISATSAFRYWRARIINNVPTTANARLSKIYFGTAFDFGREPEGLPEFKIVDLGTSAFTSSAGVVKKARLSIPFYEIRIKWIGLTDTLIQSFYNTIYKYKETTPIFLYTTTRHEVLNNFGLVHCKIKEAKTVQAGGIANYNTLELTLTEIIG